MQKNEKNIRKNTATVFLILLLFSGIYVGTAYAVVPVEEWNKTFRVNEPGNAKSVQQTGDGGYILAGETWSVDPLGNPNPDALIIKTDASGNEEWSKTFGGTSWDTANSVSQTDDYTNSYMIAGSTRSFGSGYDDAWLIRTDSNGTEQWSRTFGGTGFDNAYSVGGGYVIAGSTESYGAGGKDVWVIRPYDNGYEYWNKTFGGTGTDIAYSAQIVLDSWGNYLIINHIIAGETSSYGSGKSDAWLIKISDSGYELWNRTFGRTGFLGMPLNDRARSVLQAWDDGYILAGDSRSYYDSPPDFAWLIKTDSFGFEQWNKSFGTGTGAGTGNSVGITSDGGYVLAGSKNSHGPSGYDAWLAKTDSRGNEEWNMTFGGAGDDYANAVWQTRDGGYILAGYTNSYGDGGTHAWLIKVSNDILKPIGSCTTISSPGIYELTTDIIGSSAATCIDITSNNVIFDGKGHTIDGVDAWDTTGISAGNSTNPIKNVIVKNLKVTGWNNGIRYDNVKNGKIENINASSNTVGIQLTGTSNYNILTNNIITLTPFGGYGIGVDNSHYNILTNNTANQNSGTGIILGRSNNNILVSNNASLNGDIGIWLTGSSNYNNLTKNILTGNGFCCGGGRTGILMDTSGNNILNDNIAENNLRGIILSSSEIVGLTS